MSRYYEMTVILRGVNPARVDAIKEAAESCWDFEDWHPLHPVDHPGDFQASGYGDLCSGKTEQEFAEDLAKQIWAASGGFCEVEVVATYLEDLPHETYSFDEDDFEELTSKSETAESDSPEEGKQSCRV
jgi:hypothetical protein